MTNVFLCFRSWRNSCSRESKQFLGGHSQPGHSSWFAIISDKFVVVMVSACAVSDVRMMTGVCWWRTRWHLLVLAATGGGAWPAAWLAAWCAGGAGLARTLQRLHCRCYRHRHHRAHAALAALPIMIAVQTCHQGPGSRRVKQGPAVQFASRRQWLNRGSVMVWVSREMTGPWHHDWSVCSVAASEQLWCSTYFDETHPCLLLPPHCWNCFHYKHQIVKDEATI